MRSLQSHDTVQTRLSKYVAASKNLNLYGCTIGDNVKTGAFVEIQKNAFVGNNGKISSHTFICEGMTIGDDVFMGQDVATAGGRASDGSRLGSGEDACEERRLDLQRL
jgi:acetyltransferase-like isoleucine patch superfamily enzyme